MACRRSCHSLNRKKQAKDWLSDSSLRRCLTLFDLTSLGTGTFLGAGLYVAVGELARDVAGPAIVLSFLMVSIAALLCVFSYAEFACRIPKAGSAYVYTYVTLGEIWAFIVGWTVASENIIAGASLARACSEYLNVLFQGEIYQFFMQDIATWNHPGIAPFPDFLAAAIVVAVIILVCLGVRSSSNVQKVVTLGHIFVVFFMVIYGLWFVDLNNWTSTFTPYGVKGVLRGAASACFALAGFDVVTTAAEEAVDPERNIPLSLILTITISGIAYLGVTTVLTLVLPYQELASFAPLAKAFSYVRNFPPAEHIVACGGICATISGLVSALFSSSRILYAMSLDGLLFSWFSPVNDKSHSPIRTTVAAGVLTAVLALIFDINQLVELLSFGILLAYVMVTICLLVSRYQPEVHRADQDGLSETRARTRKWLESLSVNSDTSEDEVVRATYQPIISREGKRSDGDTALQKERKQSFCVNLSVFSLVASIAGLAVVLSFAFQYLSKPEWGTIFLICLFAGTAVVSLVALQLQPQNKTRFTFMVPGVPYVPAISIFINVLLMVNLQWMTYARFGIWMSIGFIIYFLYGYRHSMEAIRPADFKEGEFVLPDNPDFESIVNRPQIH